MKKVFTGYLEKANEVPLPIAMETIAKSIFVDRCLLLNSDGYNYENNNYDKIKMTIELKRVQRQRNKRSLCKNG
jgi:hypothetical protein